MSCSAAPTGCIRAKPSPARRTAASRSIAAKSSAARPRSTASPMCAAIAAITIAGRKRGSINGPTRMCCPISAARSGGKAGRAPIAAAMGRSIRSSPQSSRPAQRCDPRRRHARRLSLHAGLQRRAAGRFLPQPVDDQERQAVQRGGRLSSSGAGARQQHHGRDGGAGAKSDLRRRRARSASNTNRATRSNARMPQREVILSGGAINSPQLLMLSGIGDGDELRRHGIAREAASAACRPESARPYGRVGRCDPHRARAAAERAAARPYRDRHLARAHLFGTGPAATIMNNVQAYLKSDPSEKMPDIQFLFRVAPLDAGALPATVQARLPRRLWRARGGAAPGKPRAIVARLRRSACADQASRRISSRATRI